MPAAASTSRTETTASSSPSDTLPVMPADSDFPASQAANAANSSDFVRKLYRMLEDPNYGSVVRWGNEGDSFVVLENEKFTKTILPKHFKHSNFASFVRQLNKYDFHKVRQSDENGQSPYGPGAWEFKHPEFRADKKDNLDSIRRKAPAPRKTAAVEEAFPATQQVSILSDQVVATQHQIQTLQEQYLEVMQTNRVLVNEVVNLQKMVKAQSQIAHELINHLNNMDERRRSSRHPGSAHSGHSNHSASSFSGGMGMLPDSTDEPAQELRRAREILNGVSSDPAMDRELHRLSVAYHQAGSPADSASTSSMLFPPPAPNQMGIIHDPLGDMRHLVYPVGQTTGIDPFHADHIQNIPYTRPLSNPNPMAEAPRQMTPPLAKDPGKELWLSRKPLILLVEDDKICARIGQKFLSQADCQVETARDGSEAVTIVNSNPDRFDLIFMDIIMPVFDGVSATAMIRLVAPRIPIIAMTSNIRSEDIATYFQYAMNDVLAKPFTKEGMIRILRKHLPYMLKNPPLAGEDGAQNGGPPMPTVSTPGYSGQPNMGITTMGGAHGGMAGAGGPVKFDHTPIQSPATTSSWHSPTQHSMSHTSPPLDGGGYMSQVGGSGQVVMTPGGTQAQHFPRTPTGPMPPGAMSRIPDGLPRPEERPEKRQRVYGPSGGYAG